MFFQARSIQELAKKDFENLRQDSDDGEVQPKVARRGRPPGKSLKKSLGRSPDCVGPVTYSEVTLATGVDKSNFANGYNLRKGVASYKPRTFHGSDNAETSTGWMSELENEFPGLRLCFIMIFHFMYSISSICINRKGIQIPFLNILQLLL